MTEVRVAVVGAGVFGLEHLDALSRSVHGRAVALCDLNPEVANRAGDLFRIPHVYLDVDEMLGSPGIDAVIIAAPSNAHAELSTRCLGAGKHILIEKPIAMSVSEIDTIRRASTAHPGLVVMPGHVLRYSRTHRRIQQAIQDGEIGTVLSFVASRDRERGHHRRYADISPTLLTMVHDIDLALWMTRQTPTSASALAIYEEGAIQPSVVHAQVRTAEGAVWSLRASWALPTGASNEDRFDVFGSSGALHFRNQPDFLLRREADSAVPFTGSGRIYDSDLDEEVEQFLAAILDGTEPAVTLEDAAVGLRVVEAIERSAFKHGEQIDV